MRKQDGLQLCRGHLEAFVLNQLFHAIDNEKVALLIGVTDVAGMQPAIRVDGPRGRFQIVEVTFHHLWSAHPQLTFLIRTHLCTARGID